MFLGYLSRSLIAFSLTSTLVLALTISSAQRVDAGIIQSTVMFGPNAGVGPGVGAVNVPVIFSPNPNNDNQTGGGGADNNVTVPIKRFDNNGIIDIVFNVVTSGGVTEYKFFESVDNNTFLPWSSYTMQLGFGIGNFFVPSPPADGLDFDDPDYDFPPTSSVFTSVAQNNDTLIFSNGLQLTGSQTYQFRIDVPDGISQFTLRQVPTPIPEPGSLALLGCGIAGAVLLYRKRR
jgi:hypothetical protein